MDDRLVFEEILWNAQTGVRWKNSPDRYRQPLIQGHAGLPEKTEAMYEDNVLMEIQRAFLSEVDQILE